jgi:hypothetical protein
MLIKNAKVWQCFKNVERVEECPQKCKDWNMLKPTCK